MGAPSSRACRAAIPAPPPTQARSTWLPTALRAALSSCARHCAGYLIGIILLSPPHKLIGQVLSSPLCKEEPEARGGEVASQVYSHKVAKTPSPPPSAQPALGAEA